MDLLTFNSHPVVQELLTQLSNPIEGAIDFLPQLAIVRIDFECFFEINSGFVKFSVSYQLMTVLGINNPLPLAHLAILGRVMSQTLNQDDRF